MGGVGSGRWPKGYKVKMDLAAQLKKAYYATMGTMSCLVCQRNDIHYRSIKRHMVAKHDWGYLTDGEFPEPRAEAAKKATQMKQMSGK